MLFVSDLGPCEVDHLVFSRDEVALFRLVVGLDCVMVPIASRREHSEERLMMMKKDRERQESQYLLV